MTRTDIHSEKSLQPENYSVVEYIYTKAPEFFGAAGAYADEMAIFRADMERVQKMLQERGAMIHGGWSNCDHCGAAYNHGVILEHVHTHELITVGWICAEQRFSLGNLAFQRKRIEKVMKAIRARRGRFSKLRQFVENNPEVRLLSRGSNNQFLTSLRCQLVQHGKLSERQLECIAPAVEKQAKWDADRAEKEATEVKVPAPEGRVEIEGEVVHLKLQIGDYQNTLKMLVVCDGFKVWSTVPSSLDAEDLKGKRVKFTAALTRSDKDESFDLSTSTPMS